MRNFQCSKCGTLISSDRMPSSIGCPSGRTHEWHNLGECGDTIYQCRKCGTLVNSERMPSSIGCPSGRTHEWTKLR